jgi:hypothetical protein
MDAEVALIAAQFHRVLHMLLEVAPSASDAFEGTKTDIANMLSTIQAVTQDDTIVRDMLGIKGSSVEILEGGVRKSTGTEIEVQTPGYTKSLLADRAQEILGTMFDAAQTEADAYKLDAEANKLAAQRRLAAEQEKGTIVGQTKEFIATWTPPGVLAGSTLYIGLWAVRAGTAATTSVATSTLAIPGAAIGTLAGAANWAINGIGSMFAETASNPTFGEEIKDKTQKGHEYASGFINTVTYMFFGKPLEEAIPDTTGLYICLFLILTVLWRILLTRIQKMSVDAPPQAPRQISEPLQNLLRMGIQASETQRGERTLTLTQGEAAARSAPRQRRQLTNRGGRTYRRRKTQQRRVTRRF